MLTVCTKEKCHSSKRAKKWLEQHQISYKEIKLKTQRLKKSEFIHILLLTEHGTGDILSHRSSMYKQLETELDDLLLSELWVLICQTPSLLRSPIIFDERTLLIGFNSDEMRTLISREKRKQQQQRAVLEYALDYIQD